MSKSRSGASIHVRQVRSGIGFAEDQKATLRALGLGKIGRTRALPDNPQVRGMLHKISHLVRIVEPEADAEAGQA